MLKKLSSTVAHTYILYCQNTPNHRGRQRLAKILDWLFGSFTVKSSLGQLLEVYLSSSMDLSFITKNGIKSHERITEIIKELKEGDVFIDIGANIGFFSLFAAGVVGQSGRVLSYEPSPREFKRLLNNIEINGANNILPYNLALSDYVGEAKLCISEKVHTGINALIATSQDNSAYKLAPICSGDLLIAPFLDPFLDRDMTCAIKVDVEGAEFLVLSGLRSCLNSKNIKSVVIEITPKFLARYGHTKEDIYNLMSQYGFEPTLNSSDWQYDEAFIR